jgi:hypothetical protein
VGSVGLGEDPDFPKHPLLIRPLLGVIRSKTSENRNLRLCVNYRAEKLYGL